MYKPTLDIINEIREESSSNNKLEIIKKWQHHEEFMTTVKLALDPMTTFGIKQIPEYNVGRGNMTLKRAQHKLSLFTNRTYTGNTAKKQLRNILESLEFDDAQCIEMIINKSLDCGASAKIFNKALGHEYITQYPVNTCGAFNEATKRNINYPAIIQTKMDGMRCNAYIARGMVTWFTRNGRNFNLSPQINRAVEKVCSNGVLDGELLVVDSNGQYLSRKKGNGIINKITKHDDTLRTLTDKKSSPANDKKIAKLIETHKQSLNSIVFVVWDSIQLNAFHNRVEALPYGRSFDLLSQKIGVDNPIVRLVESKVIDNEQEALWFYNDQLSKGNEGAILKDVSNVWGNKRSNKLLKLKAELEMDLIILEVGEGAGRITGKLGKFLCESADGEIRVSVGTGFSDSQREEYFDNSMVGKTINVKFNEVIDNDRGTKSLFLPVFIEVREDIMEIS